ncbi:hypothetical protein GQ457_10G029980 [Hibiscus cannabinus]
MTGGAKQSSFRKALGAIKDTTTVSLAKVHSDYKVLDIAIVKATSHYERPAKEKYIKAIFASVSATKPRADVAYCIHSLARRLSRTHNWVVALKTLMVIHRALREVDPTFHEEVINYGRSRRHMLNLSHFKDDSNLNKSLCFILTICRTAWDYSAWVRSYASFLEERLECFRILKYDIEMTGPRTKDLDTAEVLEHLPALQQLLFRVLGCQPIGAAAHNLVIQLALSLVASESVNIYRALTDGSVNLVDKFFDMQRPDAVRALNIYRRCRHQADGLSEFYEVCKRLDIGRGDRYIKIEQPPASFLQAMEDYVSEAPRASKVRNDQQIEKPKEVFAMSTRKPQRCRNVHRHLLCLNKRSGESGRGLGLNRLICCFIMSFFFFSYQSLNDPVPVASKLDEKNTLAMAIVPVAEQTTPAAALFKQLVLQAGNWHLSLLQARLITPLSLTKWAADSTSLCWTAYMMMPSKEATRRSAIIHGNHLQRLVSRCMTPFTAPAWLLLLRLRSRCPQWPINTKILGCSAAAEMMMMTGSQQPPSNAFGYPYGAGVHPYTHVCLFNRIQALCRHVGRTTCFVSQRRKSSNCQLQTLIH